MQHALLIAEKPSLMREIQAVYEKHKGDIPYGIDFTSQSGHLLTLKLPREMDDTIHSRSWDNLPYVPEDHGGWQYKVIQEKKQGKYLTPAERYKQISNKLHSGEYQFVIHAGDPDQEGELLVNIVLRQAANRLRVMRFWTNDLTEPHILYALQHLKDDEKDPMLVHLLEAAYGRQHSDYRVGMNISEAASLKMHANIACGRVMTPILAIVCRREDEIENFHPTTVYGVQADYAEGFTGQLYDARASETEEVGDDQKKGTVYFETAREAEELIRKLEKTGKVTRYTVKRTNTKAPKLYKLSSIQTDAGHLYGYPADKVLALCQSLYEKKILSYPRTDCEYLSSDENFFGILKALNTLPDFHPFIKTISRAAIEQTGKDRRWINDKALEDSGHSALRPTTVVPGGNSLSADEWNIYRLVARRFIAMFLPPLVQDSTEILTDISGYTFRSTGKTVVSPGYTSIFGSKPEETTLPVHKEGDELSVREFEKTEKTTECPKRFTSPDLIAACENPLKYLQDKELKKLGKNLKIGTPATRSSIIRKLINLEYIKESRKGKTTYIIPSANGRAIIRNLNGMMICRVDMTGIWEEELEQVRQGEETLQALDAGMKDTVAAMVREIRQADMTEPVKMRAPAEKFTCTWQGRSAAFNRVWNGHRFTDEECADLSSGKDICFQEPNTEGDPCSYQGRLAVQTYKGRQYLGFLLTKKENLNPEKKKITCTWNGVEKEFSPSWGGHVFTKEETDQLTAGKTITFVQKNKDGDECRVTGALGDYTFKGHKLFGFQMQQYTNLNPQKETAEGIWQGRPAHFKRVWGGYRFSDDEVGRLFKGETVTIQKAGRNGKPESVTGCLETGTWKGHSYLGFKIEK